jgi:hypothetical protein
MTSTSSHSTRAPHSHSHMDSTLRRACDADRCHLALAGLLLAVVLIGCSSETSTPEPTTTTPPPTYTVGPPTAPGVATISVTIDTVDPAALDGVLREVAAERGAMDEAWVEFVCPNGEPIGLGQWATTQRARAANGFGAEESYRVEVTATGC